ncbi:pseudouridine synthase [Acidimangrovimonas sediminis]|uniref:pseudouridine synthase n=1 Tax=Acidimangrovimonas sediminis TaxID=2056283 RepID=UPI000C805E41|nr:pseudouridine synthase [Acidimangrovimonas sediminis]
MSTDTPPSDKTPPQGRAGDRIAKVIARAGLASRRGAEEMVAQGRVSVNGKVIDSPALNVTDRDRITVDGTPLAAAEPPRLWLYHKPEGLVTSAKDEKGRRTVFDALPEDMPRVMSIGRLDLNSEGLLLLTNDGEIKRRLELPSTGWLRKYRVRVKGAPDDAMLAPLRKGMEIEGERFQGMDVTLDRQQGSNAWLTVGLREGKNREIRRAMEAVGLTVNRLIRISYGPFRLGELAPGAVEEVRAKVLRDQLGLDHDKPEPTGTAKARPRGKGPGRPVPKSDPKAGPKEGLKAGFKASFKTGGKAATMSGVTPMAASSGRGGHGDGKDAGPKDGPKGGPKGGNSKGGPKPGARRVIRTRRDS